MTTNRPAVMVVEDDELIRDSVVEYLEAHGYEALAAGDGLQALRILRSAARKPCVVLLDLMMPVMDGRQFREEQLRDPEIASIPVIVVSASRDVDALVSGLGVSRVFTKPMKLSELLREVAQHDGRQEM